MPPNANMYVKGDFKGIMFVKFDTVTGRDSAIKKFEAANFIQMVFLGNGKLIDSFTSLLRRDELVLRQLITKLNEPLKV